jgi:hypothetical protein
VRISTIKQRARRVGLLLLLTAASATPLAAAQDGPAASAMPLAAAAAQAPKAALVVTRGEGAQDCPDSTIVAERVRGVAGANVIGAELGLGPFETWVQVAISRNFGGYSAQISTSGVRHGSRVLEDLGPTCASLADAIAVTLAIFLDPYANALPPKTAPPATAPAPQPVPRANTNKPAEPTHRTRFFLDAGAGVALNVLGHAMPLVAANAGLRPAPSWSLSLGGGYVLLDTLTSPGGKVELSLAYANFRGCGRAMGAAESVHLDWCLAAMLGSLRGRGSDYAEGFDKRAAWVAVAVGPEVVFPFTRSLSWILTGEAVLPLVRNGFEVQSNGSRALAFRPSAVGGLISLGVRGDL